MQTESSARVEASSSVCSRTRKVATVVAMCGTLSAACKPPVHDVPRSKAAPVTAPVARSVSNQDSMPVSGIDPDAIDEKANPCEDFYQYACGGWIARTTLTPGENSRKRVRDLIVERNAMSMKKILTDAESAKSPNLRLLGEFYAACMDEPQASRADLSSLQPIFDVIGRVRDAASLLTAVATLHQVEIQAMFSISHWQWRRDPVQAVATLDSPSFGLGDPSSYSRRERNSLAERASYHERVAEMFRLYGMPSALAEASARHVLTVETALARDSKTATERRGLSMYNRVDRAGLIRLAGDLDWSRYFDALGFSSMDAISVTSPHYFASLSKTVKSIAPAVWRDYLTWSLLSGMEGALPNRFSSYESNPPDRWRTCLNATGEALGNLLSEAYVSQNFSSQARSRVRDLAARMRTVMEERLERLDWMDDQTKRRAIAKLSAMLLQIGYPDNWNSEWMVVQPTDFLANVLAGRRYRFTRNMSTIGKAPDRNLWDDNPTEPRAEYSGPENSLLISAAWIQPPRFDPSFDLVVNMGAFGSGLAHEFTHAFDDIGSYFDERGNFGSWWPASTRNKFDQQLQAVIDKYNSYEILPGLKVDGKLTLSENVADIGGLKLAYATWVSLRAESAHSAAPPSPREEQSFYISFGQAYCDKSTDAALVDAARSSPHSPRRFRVNGAASEMPEFARAFRCAVGSPMNPRGRCDVW